MIKKAIKEETQPVPRKIRGTLEALGKDCYKFTPQGKGESTQANVVTIGNSKTYETIGKNPQRVAHLVVPATAVDFRAELFRQVDELTRQEKQEKEAVAEVPAESVILHKGEGMKLVLDEKGKKFLFVQELPLKRGTNYVGLMIAAVNRCSQTITANKEMISKLETQGI